MEWEGGGRGGMGGRGGTMKYKAAEDRTREAYGPVVSPTISLSKSSKRTHKRHLRRLIYTCFCLEERVAYKLRNITSSQLKQRSRVK